jgi:hypothetical protein
MQMTNGYIYRRVGQPRFVEERHPGLLPMLHEVIRQQAEVLDDTGRLLLGEELQRVACEYQQARDGRSQLVLRLLQGLHRQLGPALKLHQMEYWAVRGDDLPCFLYAHANRKPRVEHRAVHKDDPARFFYPQAYGGPPREDEPEGPIEPPMTLAARYRAVSILEYGLQHREQFQWEAEAPLYAAYRGDVQVLDLVICGGCALWNAALSIAAGQGHVACVRLLHKRGVPIWDRLAYAYDFVHAYDLNNPAAGITDGYVGTETVLYVPGSRDYTTGFPPGVSLRSVGCLWGVLRYGQIYDAPVPGWAALVLKDRREKARAVLLSFRGAARYARGGGEHAQLYGLMANVPLKVLHMLLVAAELELEETFNPVVHQAAVIVTDETH